MPFSSVCVLYVTIFVQSIWLPSYLEFSLNKFNHYKTEKINLEPLSLRSGFQGTEGKVITLCPAAQCFQGGQLSSTIWQKYLSDQLHGSVPRQSCNTCSLTIAVFRSICEEQLSPGI